MAAKSVQNKSDGRYTSKGEHYNWYCSIEQFLMGRFGIY